MKPRALVVDDDPEIIQTVGDILVSLNHEYDSADSVTAARQCIERKDYTYYLIDLQIPVHSAHGVSRIQNGENLIDEIIRQDDDRKKRIIAITAYGNDGPHQAVEIMKKGIADYIPKPFPTSGKTLDKAILAILARLEGAIPRLPEPTRTDLPPDTPAPFAGGTMVFFPDRVELCGFTICGGLRCEQARKTLDLLRQKNTKGDFVAFSSKKLANEIGREGGSPAMPGLIRDVRTRIVEELRQVRIECQRHDVIERTKRGYHFRDWINVQDGKAVESPAIEGHEGAASLDDVPVNGSVDGPVDLQDADPVSEAEDAAGARQKWILEQVTKGRKLRAPGFAAELGCSDRTVKRDLDTLEPHIEFVGSPRTGHYRLRKVTHPR